MEKQPSPLQRINRLATRIRELEDEIGEAYAEGETLMARQKPPKGRIKKLNRKIEAARNKQLDLLGVATFQKARLSDQITLIRKVLQLAGLLPDNLTDLGHGSAQALKEEDDEPQLETISGEMV